MYLSFSCTNPALGFLIVTCSLRQDNDCVALLPQCHLVSNPKLYHHLTLALLLLAWTIIHPGAWIQTQTISAMRDDLKVWHALQTEQQSKPVAWSIGTYKMIRVACITLQYMMLLRSRTSHMCCFFHKIGSKEQMITFHVLMVSHAAVVKQVQTLWC